MADREQCWVMNTTLVDPPPEIEGSVETVRKAHHDYLVELDGKGALVGAGSFRDENGERHGTGMIIIRAETRAEAEEIANAEPYIANGFRILKLTPWQKTLGH